MSPINFAKRAVGFGIRVIRRGPKGFGDVRRRIRGFTPIPHEINTSDESIAEQAAYAVSVGGGYLEVIQTHGLPLRGRIMEMGPGANFGSTLVLACHGATIGVSDKWLPKWNPNYHPKFYRALVAAVRARWPEADVTPIQRVLDHGHEHVVQILRAKAEKLPQDVQPFNLILSNAVYEHIENLDRATRRVFAITAPGGYGVHQIDFRDHRQFDRALDFLTMSAREEDSWLKRTQCFYGAPRRYDAFERAFRDAGFEIVTHWVTESAKDEYLDEIVPKLRAATGSRYRDTPREMLVPLGACYIVRRPA